MTRLLIVDDRPLDAAVAVRLLRRIPDWDLEQCSSGGEALASLQALPADLVLTDLHMPQMDGLELLKAIQRIDPDLPVVVMTSRGDERKAVKVLMAGAASYLPKALLESDLIATCRRVLDSAALRRDQAALMDHLTEERFELVLENERRHLAALVDLIVGRCLQFEICSHARAPRVGVAIEEAVVNAMIHGNLEVSSELREESYELYDRLVAERMQMSPYQDRRLTVRVHLTRQRCQVNICDEGPGFDQKQLRDPTDPENVARVSGRGILLMRTFLDDVRYNDLGNSVTLVIARSEQLPNPLADLSVSGAVNVAG
jgi:DNA-binding NarL/FixJ family response regulator/anti-sigma regulatory factor (Ser/Thr protein kinase)